MIEEKKKMDEEKKNTIVGVIAVIVIIGIIVGGVVYFMHKKDANKSSEFGGISTTITQYPEIQDGKNVGTYAVADYNAKTTTNAQIMNYFNKKINGRKDNYFLLSDGNNYIEFPGCSQYGIMKGTYNSNHKLGNINFFGQVNNNVLTWTKANPQN